MYVQIFLCSDQKKVPILTSNVHVAYKDENVLTSQPRDALSYREHSIIIFTINKYMKMLTYFINYMLQKNTNTGLFDFVV